MKTWYLVYIRESSCENMMKKGLKIVFNVGIILYFLFLTTGMTEILVSDIKYYLEMEFKEDIFIIFIDVIYIFALWSSYLSYFFKNKIIKIISLFAIIISLYSVCLVEDILLDLNWILFLYLPIILVFILGIIRNKEKSEV